MKRLDDMRLFATVVELNTFSAAAESLEMSRSLLSRRISSLEDSLGIRLLNRTTRRLDLTEGGTAYYEYCRRVVETAQEAEESISSIRNEPAGLLRVAGLGLLYAPLFFVEQHLADGTLIRLLEEYPMTGDIYALYPHRMITMKERAFLDFLCEKVPSAVGSGSEIDA